jgi:succinoglycan biosynthesis transport protein ExoP
MEEVSKFLTLLKRYRLVLIIVPVLIVIITFFLVKNIPNSYVSQAQIATGIVDETKQNLLDQATPQAQQVVQEFSNIIAVMRLKKILDKVSYKLAIHDLSSPKPFKPKNNELVALNAKERKHAIDVFTTLYSRDQSLNLYEKEQNALNDFLKSLDYDTEFLNNKLNIFRAGDSDFVIIQFESEDPLLSAFIVNTLSNEFINYYTAVVKNNQIRTNTFLGNLLAQKNDTLSRRMSDLRNYKIRNRVLNLGEQSKQLYTRIIEYDNKKQEAVQSTSSFAGALNEIDRKFQPEERQYIEASLSKLNTKITNKKDELSRLYDLYYQNDLEENYKRSIDSLQLTLNEAIAQTSDEYINNPLSTKLALIQEKLGLEVKLDISRYSINSLEKELAMLNNQFDQLVPKEAEVQSLEMKIDIATKEYLDILNKYNQSSLESGFQVKLNIVQMGMPGLPQPSKKMLLVILSGIIGFIFCLVIIFISFLLDDSIISSKSLADKSGVPVLGSINKLITPSVELTSLWHSNSNAISPLLLEFKDQLRSLRFEIEKDLTDKLLIVTSVDKSEGKTMVALSLAFAWKMTNKRVLLIDGNFQKPDISSSANNCVYLEDVLRDVQSLNISPLTSTIDILCNKGENTSLLEIAAKEEILSKFDFFKSKYDIVIIETSALDNINQAKEWLLFSNNVVAVFSTGQILTQSKMNYVNYLKESGSFLGWVFNKTSKES